VSDTQNTLVDQLSNLKVIELAALIKQLEEKWEVSAAPAAVAVAAAPAAGGDAGAAAEESTEFEVTLAEAPADKKIAVIKVVREVTGLGLREAKEIVESAPKVIKESVGKTEADEIAKKFADAGAKATLKGL
jgi:large subunit ribosomal protein L7/L12